MRTFVFVMISLLLMFANQHFVYFNKLRSSLSLVTVPIQYLVSQPVEWLRASTVYFKSRQQLMAENADLQAQQFLLQAKLQRLLALEQENAQLRELLSSASQFKEKALAAQVLAVDMNPFSQQVLVNKGQRNGVYVGQPVLDAHGVMGQVVFVNLLNSQVLLITDSRSALPVQDNRSGVRAVAVGTGYGDELQLLHVPDTSDVKVGDMLVTSGLGQRFPYGYPVGVISFIRSDKGARFAVIKIKPAAEIDKSRQVLLIWYQNGTDQSAFKPLPSASPAMNQKHAADEGI